MADLDFYQRTIGISTIDELCEALCQTLLKTNRTYSFWVDWDKASRNTDNYKLQLGLLSTLRGSTNPRADFKKLLKRYPEVAEALPRLLAEHEHRLTIAVGKTPPFEYVDIDFSVRDDSPTHVQRLVRFSEETGLLALLASVTQPQDYLLGVEVGLDSNARKNRSGVVLEALVEVVVDSLCSQHSDMRFLEQDIFGHAAEVFGVECPPAMTNRRFDFAVLHGGVPTNIEVNFYGGTGSKPSEIVNSYSDRTRVLKAHGWRFVWVTDGPGWIKMRNPLRKGVSEIDYVLNYQMLHEGLLTRVLMET
jgi:type II restriction enzyme